MPSNRRTVTRSSPTGLRALQPVRRITLMFVAVALLLPLSWVTSSSSASAGGVKHRFVLAPTATAEFPSGIADLSEPSGQAPPRATSFPGYVQKYVQDFNGTSLPAKWDVFTGKANGGSGSQWGSAHVVVGGGLLSLNTYQDPAYNNQWVSGGLCMCGAPSTYGAYFIRSRETGPGPTIVELLWPVVAWPPEIDFNETSGVIGGTSATLIYGPGGRDLDAHVGLVHSRWPRLGTVSGSVKSATRGDDTQHPTTDVVLVELCLSHIAAVDPRRLGQRIQSHSEGPRERRIIRSECILTYFTAARAGREPGEAHSGARRSSRRLDWL